MLLGKKNLWHFLFSTHSLAVIQLLDFSEKVWKPFPRATETFLHVLRNPYTPLTTESEHFRILECFSDLDSVNKRRTVLPEKSDNGNNPPQPRMLYYSILGVLPTKQVYGRSLSDENQYDIPVWLDND